MEGSPGTAYPAALSSFFGLGRNNCGYVPVNLDGTPGMPSHELHGSPASPANPSSTSSFDRFQWSQWLPSWLRHTHTHGGDGLASPSSGPLYNFVNVKRSPAVRARLVRNILLILAGVLLAVSILNSAQPDAVRDGMSVLGDKVSSIRLWPTSGGGGGGGYAGLKGLDDRLRDLMERPALDQWEMEPTNRHSCPMYTYSRNTYFYHEGKGDQWSGIKRNDVRRYRNAIVSYLKEIEASGEHLVWSQSYIEDKSEGEVRRGIILTGGEGSSFKRLKILLDVLRGTLGSTLAVEIYHFPDEMQDPSLRGELESYGNLKIITLQGKNDNGKNWHIKNSAFLQSEFTEFIYMDSDNIPLTDPEEHFDSVEYRTQGSVFWPDLYKDHPDNAIWRILGKPCSDDHWPFEAGQIVFDKRGNNGLNLAVLHLSNHMMTHPEAYGFLSYGDKDTFRFSFYALDLEFGMTPNIFASAGGFQTQNGDSSPDYFCGHSMLQWGLTPWKERHSKSGSGTGEDKKGFHPEPAFLHTILAKHRQHLQADKLWSHIRRPRKDNISEPTLVRTPYEFTGDCFALTLKGPDGLPGVENSMRDGQGVLTIPLEEAFLGGKANKVLQKVKELQQPFVDINEGR